MLSASPQSYSSFDISDFFNHYQSSLNHVNTQILEYISHSRVPLVADASTHLIQAGGKRLRPLLVITCAELLGATSEDTIAFATAVEFIHTATLLHDDVIDNADTRRGQETAARIWGNKTSILAGDYLLSKAFECALKTRHFEGLNLLSRTTSQIAEGEILQLSFDNKFDMSLDDCLAIMRAKTAVLFAACCQLGGITQNEYTPEHGQHLYEFGLNVGIAFQITDDLLDYMGSNETFGKEPGNDLQQKNITMPALIAHYVSPDEKAMWQQIFSKTHKYCTNDLDQARKSIIESGAEEKCRELAEKYTNAGLEALDKLPLTPQREQLRDIVQYLTRRDT